MGWIRRCSVTFSCITPSTRGWAKHHAANAFERYADDAIVHCRTEKEAEHMREAITRRLAECGLEVNLQKTKIVYCKDDDRKGNYEQEKFTFLGYEFRPRRAKNRYGTYFVSFLLAIKRQGCPSYLAENPWMGHCSKER